MDSEYIIERRKPVPGSRADIVLEKWRISGCPLQEAIREAHKTIKTDDGEYLLWRSLPDM